MVSPLTEAREHVASLLQPLGIRVFSNPQEVPTPPCAQVFYGESWVVRKRLGGGGADVGIRVRVSVAAVSGHAEAINLLDSLVWEALKLAPFQGIVSPPKSDQTTKPAIYYADLNMVVHVTE